MFEAPPSADFAELLQEATAYCEKNSIKLGTLSYYALKNTKWFDDRLAGKPCLTSSLVRIRQYMADHPNGRPRTKSNRESAA